MFVKEKPSTFVHPFPFGITMTLRRLEPWEFSAVQHRAVRAADLLREGRAAVERYGFEAEEFQALADPCSWEGLAAYLYAVELGLAAIEGWTNVCREGEADVLPVEMTSVSRLFRLEPVRTEFLKAMELEGERYLAAEGNA